MSIAYEREELGKIEKVKLVIDGYDNEFAFYIVNDDIYVYPDIEGSAKDAVEEWLTNADESDIIREVVE